MGLCQEDVLQRVEAPVLQIQSRGLVRVELRTLRLILLGSYDHQRLLLFEETLLVEELLWVG